MLIVLIGFEGLFQLLSTENLEELSIMYNLRLLVVEADFRRMQGHIVKLGVDLVSQGIGVFLLDLALVKQLVLDEVVLMDQEVVLGSSLLHSSGDLWVFFLNLVQHVAFSSFNLS